MVSLLNRTLTRVEVGTREQSITVIDLSMLFVGEICKILGFLTRIVVRHLKWGLMGHPCRSMEGSSVHDLYCEGHLKRIQRGRLLVCDLETICSYDILAKSSAIYFLILSLQGITPRLRRDFGL